MKYRVEFTVEASYEIEIDDIYEVDEAEEQVREIIQDIDCGRMDIIDDFSYDTSCILYDELGWDDESGCGSGLHNIVGTIDVEVTANSPEEALEKANKQYEEIVSDNNLCRMTFGMDVYNVTLQTEPNLNNVLEVETNNTNRDETTMNKPHFPAVRRMVYKGDDIINNGSLTPVLKDKEYYVLIRSSGYTTSLAFVYDTETLRAISTFRYNEEDWQIPIGNTYEPKNIVLTPDKLGRLAIEDAEIYENDGMKVGSIYADCESKYDAIIFDRVCSSEEGFLEKFQRDNYGVSSWKELGDVMQINGFEHNRPFLSLKWYIDFDAETILLFVFYEAEDFMLYKGFDEESILLTEEENKVMFPYLCELLKEKGIEIPLSKTNEIINALNDMDCGDTLTIEDYGVVQKMVIDKDYDEDIESNLYSITFYAKPSDKFISDSKAELGTVCMIEPHELKNVLAEARAGFLSITTNTTKSQTAALSKAQAKFYKEYGLKERE